MPSTRAGSIAGIALVTLSISSVAFTPPVSDLSIVSIVRADACSLLSTNDASTALGQTSQPGAKEFEQDCVWSHESPPRDSSRQLHVNFHSLTAYNVAKRGNAAIKVQPIPGVGDDAFYQLYPNGGLPFVWVKKGDRTISIRIITSRKNPPFTEAQLESKLLVLAKAAAAKM
jgi:hypothetical protein